MANHILIKNKERKGKGGRDSVPVMGPMLLIGDY